MFFGSVTLIALLLALISRRPLGRLVRAHFRRIEILWAAIVLRLLFIPGAVYPILRQAPVHGLPPVGGLLYILSLLLVVLFAWFNRWSLGIAVVGLGLLMNSLVIISNGGQMPADPVQVAAIGQMSEFQNMESRGEWSTFTLAKPDTRLAFLGDRLPVPMPFKEPSILSVGDLVIALGILLFFLVIPEESSPLVPSKVPPA